MEENISLLFVGDIVGKAGINAVKEFLPIYKEQLKPDFIVANGENACNGKSITEDEAKILFDLGIDVITTGNHIWDNWKAKQLLANNPKVLRPFNYPSGNVGKGYFVCEKGEKKLAVINLQGRTFMQAIDCPFKAVDYLIGNLVGKTKNIIIDFHADATAEKLTLAHYVDGRCSALIGTHTHIQTADACLLPQNTAYITDVGMTGPYDSVVGMKKDIAIKRFTLQIPYKYDVAEGDAKFCAVHILIDNNDGKALKITPIQVPEFRKERL